MTRESRDKVERPILKEAISRFTRRRALLAAGAILAALGVLGGGTLIAKTSPQRPRVLADVEETPSWRLETGLVGAASTPPSPDAQSPSPLDTGPILPADEMVTAQDLKAANQSPCPAEPRKIVDVRDFGARGDDLTDDTKAIQRANDAVARSGGRVVFPGGVYRAYGVIQDSCVGFHGENGATLVHPDGTSPGHVVRNRVRSTTGSIARGSRVLTVDSTQGFRPGVLVAVQAGGGRSRIQRTALSMDVPPYVTAISVRDTTGLNTKRTNFLFLENEVISYNGISGKSLQNVRRGLLGTKQVSHRSGSVVAQAQRAYGVVVRVSGMKVILDSKIWFSVRDADVDVGSFGMSVTELTVDGNRRPSGWAEATNPFPLKYELARWVSVRESTLRNGDHGGVSFDMGTRDSTIEDCVLLDHGDRTHRLGAAIWLFRGASHNVIRGNTISGRTSVGGITVDDRTEGSSEHDAAPSDNSIVGNTIDIPHLPMVRNAGVVITGAIRTLIADNVISSSRTGIMVAHILQGTRLSPAVLNRVYDNTFVSHKVGIVVTGSDNEFVRNLIRDAEKATVNSGKRNRFIDNTIES